MKYDTHKLRTTQQYDLENTVYTALQFEVRPRWLHDNSTVKSHDHFILMYRNSTEFTECVVRELFHNCQFPFPPVPA